MAKPIIAAERSQNEAAALASCAVDAVVPIPISLVEDPL
jgi:hypothetical protein